MRTIGVDVGGTKVAVASLDDTALSAPATERTELAGSDRLLDQIVRMVTAAGPAEAVGVGVPSVVDAATGTVRDSVNVPLRALPLVAELEGRLDRPVHVLNDAQAAGLGEAYDDDLRLIAASIVLLTIGTGIGGAIVLDGEVLLGASGAAGHLGHQLIAADLTTARPPHRDRAPQPGTLEALAAGRVLDALARDGGMADGRALVAAAQSGDAGALASLELLGARIGVGVANAINALDPELVVIGGGVSAAGRLLLDPIERTARAFVLSGIGTRTTIRTAAYGNLAGVRGAALHAARRHRGAPT